MIHILHLVWRFLIHPWTRYVAAWLLALAVAAGSQYQARVGFDVARKGLTDDAKKRPDGNDGHTSIDFGGQWLMGRMLVRGYGRELYNRNRYFEVAMVAYPREHEAPAADSHDAENFVGWFMDCDQFTPARVEEATRARHTKISPLVPLAAADPLQAAVLFVHAKEHAWTEDRAAETLKPRIGGPLYPPIQALMMAPLALEDEPQKAYFRYQWILIAMAFLTGAGASWLSRGRIWTPVAAVFVVVYPGFSGGHHLAQNPPISMAILVWGWALIARGKPGWGGLVWGLLAFKPVWAATFFLVPLVTGRWKTCLGMLVVGAAMVLATLPFTGVEPWKHWLEVGGIATKVYDADEHWIFLSRDILSIPRRFLTDFDSRMVPYFDRNRWHIQLASWGLLIFVLEASVRVILLRPKAVASTTGAGAAFILAAAWMGCFHFMYYDAALSIVAVFALIADPRPLFRAQFAAMPPPGTGFDPDAARDYYRPRLPETHPELAAKVPTVWGRVAAVNSATIYFVVLLIVIQTLFPYLSLSATFRARHYYPTYATTTAPHVEDGQTVGWTTVQAAMRTAATTATGAKGSEGHWTPGDPVTIVEGGKHIERTPQLEVTTNQIGPPWDTFAIIGLWAWCGLRLLARKDEGTV